jgi:APA family basic amino acid/polyamine antiporter
VDAAALVVSNVIGVGIFTTPGIVAQIVPQPGAMLALWAVGGVLAFAGASSYAALAALRPHAGGEYVYLREAFGPLAGFLTGWTSFVAGFSGAVAAGAVGLGAYLAHYVPAAGDTRPIFTVPLLVIHLTFSPRNITALVVITVLSLIHMRGLGPGRILQNTLAGIAAAALAALVVLGFGTGNGSFEHMTESAGDVRFLGWLLALVAVMFTYSGWNAAAYVAEEVRDPERNVPRALALGTGVVIALYLSLNLLYVYALPVERLAGVIQTGEAATVALFGPRAAVVITPLLLVSLAGSLSAMVIAGPRVYFAMARDGVFFAAAARVHPRYHTPARAIAAQALWSILLVLSGTFTQLLIYTGFAVVLFSGLAVLALFRLRAREPGARAGWGYPVLPALFVVASLAMVVNAIREKPGPSAAGLVLMAAGVPLYFWKARRREFARNSREAITRP